jgi:hypothetical protein
MAARPATKVVDVPAENEPQLRTPSEHALHLAATLSARLKERPLRIRRSFIRSQSGGRPPLANLLRGGQGGEVRLKLLLSLLWTAGGGREGDERHQTRPYPARAWAGLLDLDAPEGNGQRRVRDAIQWLKAEGFLDSKPQPRGGPIPLTLLREDGSGETYTDPGRGAARKKAEGGFPREDLFITLLPTFWTDGWIAVLSGRAIAMLLILADVTVRERWISPRLARERYGISEDTWSKGLAELRDYDVVKVKKEPVGEDAFDFRRVRNTYHLPRDDSGRILLPPKPGVRHPPDPEAVEARRRQVIEGILNSPDEPS